MSNGLTPGGKPGWKTTEFWMTLAGQIVGLLVMTDVIPSGDVSTVTGSLGKIVAGVFAAWTLGHYIKGRSAVKAAALFLLLFLLPLQAHAQAPTQKTCLFGRNKTDPALVALLTQMNANQQQQTALLQQMLSMMQSHAPAAPVAPQLIVLAVPGVNQQLTPQAQPNQQLVPQAQPNQQLTPQPQPNQQLTPQPTPNIILVPAPQPNQQLTPQGPTQPLTPAPQPPAPLAPKVNPGQSTVPGGFQRFTRAYTNEDWRPANVRR